MGVGSQWDTKGASKTEIGKFKVSLTVNEKVLWLQITVKNSVGVAVSDTLAQLAHELLNHLVSESETSKLWSGALREWLSTSSFADWQGLHVLLQIEIEELENEVKLVAIGVDDVEKADNVRVVHLLEEGNLTNGGGWDTLILSLEADLLESDNASIIEEIAGLVNNSVSTWLQRQCLGPKMIAYRKMER